MSDQQNAGTGWAVITGASLGLGAIFAEQLAKRGLPLVLAGRDEPRLVAVRRQVRQIAPGIGVDLVVGDLGTDAGIDALVEHLDGRAIDVLVNNAGFGTYGPLSEADPGREHAMVAVNVDALMRLSLAVLPAMLARGSGGILNVASTIAFQPAPYQASYGASKAFVLSFSQALWAETRGSGVTVTALCPGPTRTGFVDALGSDVSHTAVYRRLAAPEPVVAAGLRALDRGRPVTIPGLRMRIMAIGGRVLPGWVTTRLSGRMLRPAGSSVATGKRAAATPRAESRG
jgi:short-subunit dehydrogenase